MITNKLYKGIEKEFPVLYPDNKNATYSSLLNFSDESDKFRQRWYRYKEGYSTKLVKKIIRDYSVENKGVILDPFLGSGSTIIAANELGMEGIGFEVNPFSFFLSSLKLENYSEDDLEEFKQAVKEILNSAEYNLSNNEIELPSLSISEKVFHKNIESYFMSVKNRINNYSGSEKIQKLLNLGWLTSLETVSLYKKAGNGLKKRVAKRTIIDSVSVTKKILEENYDSIQEDLVNEKFEFNCKLYNDSCLNLDKYIENNSINGVIFSPPYANAFDYTEIYKLELWFGEFVKDYSDLKKLRANSLRSHLNGFNNKNIVNKFKSPELEVLLDELKTKKLWNKNIPIMLEMYFNQLFELLLKLYDVLKLNGFCSIVIGNSSYGGVVFPTDLLLAKFAKEIGFTVDKIEVDRFIITSSQQYFETLESKKYLRESVVCLKKM